MIETLVAVAAPPAPMEGMGPGAAMGGVGMAGPVEAARVAAAWIAEGRPFPPAFSA